MSLPNIDGWEEGTIRVAKVGREGLPVLLVSGGFGRCLSGTKLAETLEGPTLAVRLERLTLVSRQR